MLCRDALGLKTYLGIEFALCLDSARGIHFVISLANDKTSLGRPSAVCAATQPVNRRLLFQSLSAITKKPDSKSGFLVMAERD